MSDADDNRPLAVYVHIPFCMNRCSYCDFYFEATRSRLVVERTLDAIVAEAEHAFSRLDYPPVRSWYFGGGTPSIVPPDLLRRFFERLYAVTRTRPADVLEITFEANPESIDAARLAVLRDAGVGRLSLGVQSNDDQTLTILGRRSSRAQHLRVFELIAGVGPPRTSVDIMTGIPGQTVRSALYDIESIVGGLQPQHVSLYTLTVEPGTVLDQRIKRRFLPAVDPDLAEAIWFAGRDALVAGGRAWYEIANFAFPGCESIHNQHYWQLRPYLGLGPGAVSMLWHDGVPTRITNPDLFQYPDTVAGRDPAGQRARTMEPLTAPQFLLEHLMVGLRQARGVCLERLDGIFSPNVRPILMEAVETWRTNGWGRIATTASGSFLQLTDAGRAVLDRIIVTTPDFSEVRYRHVT